MSRKVLTVVIEELVVHSNGDIPGDKPSDDPDTGIKNNALLASLRYPRSGAPQITSTKQFDLDNDKPAVLIDPDHPDRFFDPLLFREEVLDSTVLSLKVTDRDAASGFEKFLLQVFSTVLAAGFTAATSGLSGVLGAVTGFGIDNIKSKISGAGDESVVVIGQAAPLSLVMDNVTSTPQRQQLPLTVPEDVVKSILVRGTDTHFTRQDETILKKGDQNGHVTLLISATPL